MSALKLGWLFWVLVLFAAAFARYIILAHRDGDGGLALAAAAAFVLMCALAVAEAFGWL